jgi:hypothetical protein
VRDRSDRAVVLKPLADVPRASELAGIRCAGTFERTSGAAPRARESESVLDESEPLFDEREPPLDEREPALDESEPALDESEPPLDSVERDADPVRCDVSPHGEAATLVRAAPCCAIDEPSPRCVCRSAASVRAEAGPVTPLPESEYDRAPLECAPLRPNGSRAADEVDATRPLS